VRTGKGATTEAEGVTAGTAVFDDLAAFADYWLGEREAAC